MAEPPLLDGAVHESETCELPGVAARFLGADGTVCTFAVTDAEWLRDPLVPVIVTV
jgi:hypothetical protein